jgi:hypothetical protein
MIESWRKIDTKVGLKKKVICRFIKFEKFFLLIMINIYIYETIFSFFIVLDLKLRTECLKVFYANRFNRNFDITTKLYKIHKIECLIQSI